MFRGQVPPEIHCFFTDTYLFLLHKDPDDPTKLRPIGIPSAMRRILTNHVSFCDRTRWATTLVPRQFAIGVDGGMDFIIKSTQLSIEKYIKQPMTSTPKQAPSRAVVYFDLKNMFNLISRELFLHIIGESFPELIPMADMLYGRPGKVHFRWADGSWRSLDMEEGSNQGCPLSSLFAALVVDWILKPIDLALRERAAARLLNNQPGDDGFGGISHIFGYVDDVTV
ncbi:hypothetical protein ACHAXR_000244, partial [Thalassiosira sp. AJA248-18]